MADMASLVGSSPTLTHPSTFAPVAALNYPVGSPVYINSSGTASLARANATITANCVGLARTQGVLGDRSITQYGDVLTLSAEDWNVVGAGSTGLTPGAPYYLSDTTAGFITTTAPTTVGLFVVPLGIALSATELLIAGLGVTGPLAAAGITENAAMFYGLTAGTGNTDSTDYAATVAVQTTAGTGIVPFPRNGPTFGAPAVRSGSAPGAFVVATAGIYEVSWNIAFLEASQLQLAVNNARVNNTTSFSGAGTQLNQNTVLVSLAAGDVVSVINPSGNAAALTVQTADGSLTHAQAPSFVIKRIS